MVPPPGSCLVAVNFSELRANSPGSSQHPHVSGSRPGMESWERHSQLLFQAPSVGTEAGGELYLPAIPMVTAPDPL